MDATDALKGYAKERLEKIRKYFPDPIMIHIVMSTERFHHRVDVNVQLHNGFKIAGTETTENMYSSIDLCIAKIERQVRKYKGRLEEKKVRPHQVETLPWSHSIVEEAFQHINGSGGEEAPPRPVLEHPSPPHFKVVKTEKFHAQPMAVADAIVQLNLLGDAFLVFRIDTDGRVAVVYKREDGSYGLIETPAQA
jgi:putative sigma-54 modulation protein